MSPFSFTDKGFGGCNFYDRLTNKSIDRWLTKYVLYIIFIGSHLLLKSIKVVLEP